MHRGVAAVVVACCLLTAGCTGLIDAPQSTGEAAVTPAPVPAEPPAPVAPGLTEAGVSDTNALARAHVQQLGNASYTLRHTRTVETAEGTVRLREVTTGEFGRNYHEYVATRTLTGESVRETTVRTRWSEGRAVEWRTVNGTTRQTLVADGRGIGAPPLPPREALFFEPTYNGRIVALFGGANVTAVTRTREEVMQTYRAPVHRVEADGAADPSKFPVVPAERVGNVSFTAVVGPSGVVYGYGVQYTVVRNGTTLHITESLRYSDVGSTDPLRHSAAVRGTTKHLSPATDASIWTAARTSQS